MMDNCTTRPVIDSPFVAELLRSPNWTAVSPGIDVANARLEQTRHTGQVLDRVAVRKLWHRRIVLGRFSAAHVGDTICTTSLPRKLVEKYRCRVYIVTHRCTAKVFQNNPFVSGFLKCRGVRLGRLATGQGHIIHRLERTFGLPMSAYPRGELFLAPEEISWARQQRQLLPQNRPVAILSAGAITESAWGRRQIHAWPEVVHALSREFTVLQPVVTRIATLSETILHARNSTGWIPEVPVRGCHTVENPSFRQFVALLSQADLFVGQNSGGAHAAAALGVSSVIVLDRSRYSARNLYQQHGRFWRNEDFLYPQHTFLLV